MATNKRTDLVSLGSGDLYINGIDVGHLKGNVEAEFSEERVPFKPANMLGNVKMFRVSEGAKIRCQTAELSLTNIRLALGVTTTMSESTTPTGLPASVSWTIDSGSSWNSLTFGGAKAIREFGVRFEHTRPNGDKVVVCLYKAVSNRQLTLPFAEEDIILQDLEFEGLADSSRAEGDQVGIILEQTN